MWEGIKGWRYPYLFPLEASVSLQPREARGPLEGEAGSVSECKHEISRFMWVIGGGQTGNYPDFKGELPDM